MLVKVIGKACRYLTLIVIEINRSTSDFYRYFTDIINMSQGIIIFFIFVCKRKVLDEIFGKKRSAVIAANISSALSHKKDQSVQGDREQAAAADALSGTDKAPSTEIQMTVFHDESSCQKHHNLDRIA